MFGTFSRKKTNPVADLVAGFGEHLKHTPDYNYLEARKYQLVFVADDMMRGHRVHDLLTPDHSQYICVAYTAKPFAMMKKNLGKATFPMIFEHDNKYGWFPNAGGAPLAAPIKGELYAVRPYQILELDKYKLNTVEFHRRRITLDIPYQTVTRRVTGHKKNGDVISEDILSGEWSHYTKQEAWMYFGDLEFWYWSNYADDTMSPVKAIIPNNPELSPYYYYTVRENVF